LAVQRGFPQTAKTSVTANSAEWLGNLAAGYLPDSTQIVDWYHGTEHVAQAATALSPQNVSAAQAWQALWRNALYLGDVDRIIAPLERERLPYADEHFEARRALVEALDLTVVLSRDENGETVIFANCIIGDKVLCSEMCNERKTTTG
jgi:hypothetical protein